MRNQQSLFSHKTAIGKTIILALLLGPFVSACATRPSEQDRNAALMQEKHEPQRKALIEDFAQKAAAGKVDDLLAMLQPAVIESNGRDAVAGYLRTEILPFFQNYQRLAPQSKSMRFEYGYGTVGRQYFKFVESGDGQQRPFVITLLADDGKLAVSSIEVGECLEGYHPSCPAGSAPLQASDPTSGTEQASRN